MTDIKYEIGDRVVYGTNGLCTIEGIELMSFAAGLPENPYYVLRPDNVNASTVYVPQNNEKLVGKMRKLLTIEEIESMIEISQSEHMSWDNDRRARNDKFRDILVRGVTSDLLIMIKCIRERKKFLIAEGKKLPTTDSNMLKQAEKLVDEEFAYVLNITPAEVAKRFKNIYESEEE